MRDQPDSLRPLSRRVLLAATCVLVSATASGSAAAQALGATVEETARVLAGTIDVHVHTLPDDRPRSIDAIDVATLAQSRGMRALVLKNHYESTAGIVYLVRTMVPGIEVFGGIDLNLTVGGINPTAVEHMTKVTGGWGRVVWMPTFDSENGVRNAKENRPFVSVSRDGALLPAVKEVIALIAQHNLVLATGHSSPAESLLLLQEGRRQGVQRMIVTHAMNLDMNLEQMQEAAKLGAYVEFVGSTLRTPESAARIDRYADAIRRIGPEFCIVSSDLGQVGNPLPPDGFADFLIGLRARGFTQQEVDRMSKENPARLLGLQM